MNGARWNGFRLVVGCVTLMAAALPLTGQDADVTRTAAPPAAVHEAAPPELGKLAAIIARRGEAFPAELNQGAALRPSTGVAEAWLASAALQLEKARDFLAMNPPDTAAAQNSLAVADKLLETAAPDALPNLVKHGRVVEYAYFSPNDGSPQPYFLYLPAGYNPQRRWPLVLFLHGWMPGTKRTSPYLVADFVLDLADKYQVIFAIPHGRTNTDFQYAGEMDVQRVKLEVEKFWPVDPERVYLLGISMGGAGAWEIGTHYPDLFAGISAINGQGDWFRFWHEKFGYPPRLELPRHLQYLIALNNPQDLAENLLNLYSYSEHATYCFLGPVHTRDMVRKLRQVGAPCDTFEDPSRLGHNTYWQPFCWDRALKQLLVARRAAEPEQVRYVTYSPRFPGANWVRLEELDSWGALARVDARRSGAGQLTLKTENVYSVTLTPPPSWSDNGAFRISWNDRDCGPGLRPDATGRIRLTPPGAAAAPDTTLRKNSAVCGPLSDVFNFPFVGVIGTSGTDADTRAAEALAAQFARDWSEYAEGRVPLLRDQEVTDAVIRQKSLILFGTPETNRILGRIGARLPFRITRESVALPDGKTFPLAGNGLILCYPNPLAPDRYVVVYHGLAWGKGRSNNHKFDLLPDFVVYTSDQLPGIGVNQYLAAGLFDAHWQYSPALTDFALPAAVPPSAP